MGREGLRAQSGGRVMGGKKGEGKGERWGRRAWVEKVKGGGQRDMGGQTGEGGGKGYGRVKGGREG